MLHDQAALAKLTAIIDAINIGMLTTEDDQGHLRSRPMATQKVQDGALWFFTNNNAPKVHEIKDESSVNVTYSDPKTQTYVSISGRASVSKDTGKIKELWTEEARSYFPGGPSDAHIGVLRIEMQAAEYWDVDARAMKQLMAQHADASKIAAVTDHKKVS